MSIFLAAAENCLDQGWPPLPVPYKDKNPGFDDWQKLRLAKTDLPQHFNGKPTNIGILLGEPSGGLVDVDVDCREALALAGWLPATRRVFGRPGKPRSHRLYMVPGLATKQYRDIEKSPSGEGLMLIEIRSTGAQTVIPPSTHESGEPITWDLEGEPTTVAADDLVAAVSRVAAAALLARHWPSTGARHEAAKALAGMLLRAGWSEEDAREFIRGVAAAAGDEESSEREKNVPTTARRLENEGKATGTPSLIELLRGDGRKVVDKVREWLGLPTSAPSRREPTPPPWPDPPGEMAFAGLAGRLVTLADPYTEADAVAILGQFLTAVGCVFDAGPHMWVGATRHTPRLFLSLVGQTARARKGDSWSIVRAVLKEAAPEWVMGHVQSGLSSGEGLIWAVRNPVEKTEPIKEKGHVTGYQTIVVDEGVSDKRLLVIEPELARVLKVLGRQGNTLSPVLRDAWDSGNLQTMTRSTPVQATGAHICLVGHITAEELRRELADTEMVNGFANRIMWLAVKRSKLLPEPEPFTGYVLEALGTELAETLQWAQTVGEMKRDAEARAFWHEAYMELSAEREGLAGALLGRAEANVLRLSMIYALLDRSVVVRPDHLLSAIELWRYAEDSVRWIFHDKIGDPVADTIDQALRQNGAMTRTQISSLFGRHETAERISYALRTLLEHKKARTYMRETEGRPIEVWESA